MTTLEVYCDGARVHGSIGKGPQAETSHRPASTQGLMHITVIGVGSMGSGVEFDGLVVVGAGGCSIKVVGGGVVVVVEGGGGGGGGIFVVVVTGGGGGGLDVVVGTMGLVVDLRPDGLNGPGAVTDKNRVTRTKRPHIQFL